MPLPVASPGGSPIGSMGGAASPSPNPGKEAAAMAKVRQAVSMLQQSVADLDMASPLGEAVIKAIGQLSKHAPATQAQPQGQSIRDLIAKFQQSGPAAALQRMMAGGQQPESPTPPAAPAA